jgi:hypothetical protein
MANLKDLARDLRRLKTEIVRGANRANEKSASGGVQVARYYSGGAITTAQLGKQPWNHPYGWGGYSIPYHVGNALQPYAGRTIGGTSPSGVQRGPIPYGDPAIINRQMGYFQGAWGTHTSFYASGLKIIVIANYDPVAKFLQMGTKWMIPRPIDELIDDWLSRAVPFNLKQEIDAAIRRTLKG